MHTIIYFLKCIIFIIIKYLYIILVVGKNVNNVTLVTPLF